MLASRHQLGAGCEAVAVTLAHALGEGRASVLLFWVFLGGTIIGIRSYIWLLTVFISGFSENHRFKSAIVACAPILSNLGISRSNSVGQLSQQLSCSFPSA